MGVGSEPDILVDELRPFEDDHLDPSFDLEDVQIESTDFADLDAGSGRIARARLIGVGLTGSRLRALRMTDVLLEAIEGSNADWAGSHLRRVAFLNCRITGLSLGESELEDVLFRGCKFNLGNLRFVKASRVTFEDCVLVDTDVQGAEIEDTRFTRCQMIRTDFDKAKLKNVDLRTNELRLTGGVDALSGTIIDTPQLMDLALPLAQAAGISVEDD
jgi:uncharacterized protein YjbI with pentapeptide repeats